MHSQCDSLNGNGVCLDQGFKEFVREVFGGFFQEVFLFWLVFWLKVWSYYEGILNPA